MDPNLKTAIWVTLAGLVLGTVIGALLVLEGIV